MTNATFIIHHGEDPDGVIAASIISEYCARQQQGMVHCFPLRYDTLEQRFPALVEAGAEEKPRRIIVADINAQRQIVEGGLLVPLTHLSSLVDGTLWLDHHPATAQHQDQLEKIGIEVIFDSQKCAALLAAQYTGLNRENYFKHLAQIAQAHDYAIPGQRNKQLAAGNQLEEIIALANATGDEDLLRHLVQDLQQQRYFAGKDLAPQWAGYLSESQRQRAEAFSQLEKTLVREAVGKYSILFALAPPILSQKPAPRYLQEKYGAEIDLVFCLFAAPFRNHMIFGRKDVSFDVVGFCQQMGGGGRNNAGGFTRDSPITGAEYSAVREVMKEKMAEYLHSSSA